MKNTGIVRRIDDLGRIVIPKEIRASFHIEEGDPLEMWLYDDFVCLRKYYSDQIDRVKSAVAALDGDEALEKLKFSLLTEIQGYEARNDEDY